MLKIRLTRVGRKHDPTYRLVVVDSRKASQSGAYLENLGFYNPRKTGPEKKALMSDFKEKADRVKYWISKGAQLSGTAHNLLVEAKVIEGKKVNVFKVNKKRMEKKAAAAAAEVKEEAPKAEEAKEAPAPEEEPVNEPVEEKPTEEKKENAVPGSSVKEEEKGEKVEELDKK